MIVTLANAVKSTGRILTNSNLSGDILYILGGTFEQGDREYTFDEMHAVDLGKLDGVEEIFKREIEDWQGDEEGTESDSDEEADESEDEDMEGDAPAGVPLSNDPIPQLDAGARIDHAMQAEEEEPLEPTLSDNRPHPRPFESLRDFFARTASTWQEMVLESQKDRGEIQNSSIKEIRKVAFQMADTKWWDSREEISAEEERQEEAGIGEVVSLADRSKETVGAGRRR